MSRYINFYADEGDYAPLLDFARESGLSAIPRVVDTDVYDRKELKSIAPIDFSCNEIDPVFYLIHDKISIAEVFYKPIKMDPDHSFLMAHVSPVIECAPCRREENRLFHSRLYIDAPKDDPWSERIYKAYDLLAKFIRKWPRVEKQTYAGPATFMAASDGNLKLMVFGRELPI